jgi:PDZ domain-containing protein
VEHVTDAESNEPKPRKLTRSRVGLGLLSIAVLGTVALSFVPAPFVVESPGPVYNTLGTAADANGKQVPLITVSGAPTYPTKGDLSMLTVWASGSPGDNPSWLDIIGGWFRPDVAIVPMEAIYPSGTTRTDSEKAGQVQMDTSKQEAIAAAFQQLGIAYTSKVQVADVTKGYPAADVLKAGDVIDTADGTAVHDVSELRDVIKRVGIGRSISLTITRGTTDLTVSAPVVASKQDGKTPVIGILCGGVYDFPFTVDIQIDNVGGPSAGMMFALGIIDTLTPGELNGGENIAGTGEITANGTVGPIGGIVQKAYAARGSGADWMLVPAANCTDLVGHVPSGLREIRVTTLTGALAAVKRIASGTNTNSLPSCSTP